MNTTLNLKISLNAFTREPIKEATYIIKKLKLANFITIVNLPVTKESFTVIRGSHVDKKSREQFKIETHKAHIYLKDVNIFENNPIYKTLPSFQRLNGLKKKEEVKILLFNYFQQVINSVLPAGIKYTFTIGWLLNTQGQTNSLKYKDKTKKLLKKIKNKKKYLLVKDKYPRLEKFNPYNNN